MRDGVQNLGHCNLSGEDNVSLLTEGRRITFSESKYQVLAGILFSKSRNADPGYYHKVWFKWI